MGKMSLKAKFLSVIGAILSLMLIVGGVSYFSLKGVVANYSHVATINLPNLEKMDGMKGEIFKMRSDVYRIAANYNDEKDRKNRIERLEKEIVNYEKFAKEYDAIPFVPGEAEIATPVTDQWKIVKEDLVEFIEFAKLGNNEGASKTQIHFKEFGELVAEYEKRLNRLMEFQSQESATWAAKAESEAARATVISLTLIVLGTFFGSVLGFMLTNRLSAQLARITESVGSASTQVSSASEQLSTAADQLSSVSQQQASALEETSASLTEIQGMAESNVKGAEGADRAAKEVFEISETTRKSMDELTSAMSSILESNARIEKLVKVIEEIGEKTEVIDDIVFKTQLLSFNASVEAERAGEHGRGFAVVAQEVGNLAQLSGKAALEISSIVKNSIKEAEAVASENKDRVEAGGQLARDTKDKMETVLSKLTGILEGISKIVDASKEQGQGIGQIGSSVESISHLTQETAGTAEESASASAELSGQAQSLMDLVNELRVIVLGQDDSSPVAAAPRAARAPVKENKVVQLKPKAKAPAAKTTTFKAVANGNGHSYSNGSDADSDAWEKL